MADMSDDELLDGLGFDVTTPTNNATHTPKEERLIAGFEDILRFYEIQGRAPQHGEYRDIFERLYAVRLEQIRQIPEASTVLSNIDHPGLLSLSNNAVALDDDALMQAWETEISEDMSEDITVLRNVRSSAERQAAEEIADRTRCPDFEKFSPLFEQVERELQSGIRQTVRFGKDTQIEWANFFILGGQLVYVAEIGTVIKSQSSGHDDARLRVIYANGTESNLLLRSLQKALYKDEVGRRVRVTDMGPLFGDTPDPEDIETGILYVLRSQSTHSFIVENREFIHKIGITGGKVETRIAAAATDATYLLADVDIVATYKLHNVNRIKVENLLHRLLHSAQIDITIEDRFGNPVKPREWFLVPLSVIDEAVQRLQDGSIIHCRYDPQAAKLVVASKAIK